jgi:hypothetical protein
MQKWEYKTMLQVRGWQARKQDQYFHRAGEWDGWIEDGKQLPTPVDMGARLKDLGDDGWELVAVVPRSGLVGGVGGIEGSIAWSSGSIGGWTADYSGFTNEQYWVFKRPKT